jgi:Putative transposase/Transposase zinc-binding domain
MGLLPLQDIFCQSSPAYERTHRVPAHYRKAARAIMQCRTAALGGHVQSCPAGHFSRIWYNSCRHRSCPQCAYIQSERWLLKQQARRLACDHYHVLFTVPHDLNPLWHVNMPQMTGLLFQSVRDTVMELLGDIKYWGAQPGMMAAFHSWGRTLVFHRHVQCLVTGGGFSPSGQWVSVRTGFLLPVHVVTALFRGKFVWGLRRLWKRGELTLPAEMRPQAFLNLLNRLGHAKKTRWNVPIRERYPHGQGVTTYVARYLRGGPLKNRQLVRVDGQRVMFTYCAHRDKAGAGGSSKRCMTLPVEGLIGRVLQHVVPVKTQVVRFYGLYHASQAALLVPLRAELGHVAEVVDEAPSWQSVCARQGDFHPESGPVCGQWLVCTATVARRGGIGPPEVDIGRVA